MKALQPVAALVAFLFLVPLARAEGAGCVPASAEGQPFPAGTRLGISCSLFQETFRSGTCQLGDDDHGYEYGPCPPDAREVFSFVLPLAEMKAELDYRTSSGEKVIQVRRQLDQDTCERVYDISLTAPCASGVCTGTGTSRGKTGYWKYDVFAQVLLRESSPRLSDGATLRHYLVCLEIVL